MEQLVKFQNVDKSYGKTKVIDNASFDIRENAICGFIGPNGAGKTTVIKLLLGIIPATGGNISIMGARKAKEREELLSSIGTIVNGPSYYGNLNAFENLKVAACMKEVAVSEKEIKELLALTGLGQAGKKKVKYFSMGMKQRLAIACSLLGNPKLLIWDEPINGLDPAGILEIRRLIMQLHEEKKVTFLISSHILSELDKVADQIILINHGKILYNGNVEMLMKLYRCDNLEDAYMKCIGEE